MLCLGMWGAFGQWRDRHDGFVRETERLAAWQRDKEGKWVHQDQVNANHDARIYNVEQLNAWNVEMMAIIALKLGVPRSEWPKDPLQQQVPRVSLGPVPPERDWASEALPAGALGMVYGALEVAP